MGTQNQRWDELLEKFSLTHLSGKTRGWSRDGQVALIQPPRTLGSLKDLHCCLKLHQGGLTCISSSWGSLWDGTSSWVGRLHDLQSPRDWAMVAWYRQQQETLVFLPGGYWWSSRACHRGGRDKDTLLSFYIYSPFLVTLYPVGQKLLKIN